MRLTVCLPKDLAEYAQKLAARLPMRDADIDPAFKTYTVAEAAKILHVSRDVVYELVRTGELPHINVGQTRIRHDALTQYIIKSETTTYWKERPEL